MSTYTGAKATAIASEILDELTRAQSAYPAMRSAHEGLSIVREEYVELEREVFVKQGKRDVAAMRGEAIQLAAMTLRFILDVCDGGKGQL